jgi:hypothetical protein
MIALSFAAHIGCKTIVLSGMDLAYTGGGQYAPGVVSKKINVKEIDALKNAPDRILWRKDKRGKFLNTAVRWVMEAAAIAQFAKRHPHIRWINATDGGLSIDGLEELPLSSAFETYMRPTFDIRGKIQREIALHPMPNIPGNILQKLEESIGRTIGHLEILAGVKQGSKALAECDLQEELAVELLFYDMPTIVAQAELLGMTHHSWELYLEIARCYLRQGMPTRST